jgi:hypothetical protein
VHRGAKRKINADTEHSPRQTQTRALVDAARDLLDALLAVSPWKLQDCWCVADDCGGAKKHSAPCLLARAAITKARGVR